jgi:hypothetical protein
VVHSLVEVVVPGADEAEVDVGQSGHHRGIRGPVGLGVVGDELAGMFFDGFVVTELRYSFAGRSLTP